MSDERRLFTPTIVTIHNITLWLAANILEQHGWCQNAGETPDGAVCPARALELAGDTCAHATNYFSSYLRKRFGSGDIERWADTPGRTMSEVLEAMRSGALCNPT